MVRPSTASAGEQFEGSGSRDTGLADRMVAGEYVEERNGGYYVAGTRISLGSVVYSFGRGDSREAIQKSFPLLKLSQIYGAIAFYLDDRPEVVKYLEEEGRRIEESTVPLSEADPELWNRLQNAREELRKPGS